MTDSLLKEKLQSFIENEGKSCSFDPELITSEYVYRMWGGMVPLDEIDEAFRVHGSRLMIKGYYGTVQIVFLMAK